MLKNITLSADECLLRRAREKAQSEHTTLNARFRQWLERYAASNMDREYNNLMEELSYAKPLRTAGMNSMNGKYFLTLSIRNPFLS